MGVIKSGGKSLPHVIILYLEIDLKCRICPTQEKSPLNCEEQPTVSGRAATENQVLDQKWRSMVFFPVISILMEI